MSSSSTPLSPNTPPTPSLSTQATTRTVAIIKNHALSHRFDIERRIQEAGLEIVKERQMEFDTESDPEFLIELFGDDAQSLAEGPVWVYVLERRRSAEVWNTLMGDVDPAVARTEAPTSLRALYGISLEQNGLMGSPDVQTAELQISTLFASSPPFPSAELPDERFNTLQSVSSSILAALKTATSDEGGYAESNMTSPSSGGRKLAANGNPHFRARAVPATNLQPDIAPRTTRAAALRAGLIAPEKKGRISVAAPRAPLTKEQTAKTFANVPGHKRAASIAVASTAAPIVAPRMTRAAALRIGGPAAATTVKRPPIAATTSSSFEGVPGHKRRETISVASVAAPTVAPRINKSAALRAAKDQAPPTSFMFRTTSATKTPGLSRSNSVSSLASGRPNYARPPSQTSIQSSRPPVSRSATASTNGTNGTNGTTATEGNNGTNGTRDAIAAPKLHTRPSSVGAPTIAPRTNKSAALRAAKKALEEEAAAAALEKKKRLGFKSKS